jgi:hypothetical protein
MEIVLIIFLILVVCYIIMPKEKMKYNEENFEKVKINLKKNPINLNINNSNNCNNCNGYPDIVMPIYAPWRNYFPPSSFYPYYPFYPYYYNNYYL